MKNSLDISTQHYFPFHIVLLGCACIPLIVIPIYPLLSFGLLFLVILIFTTHYRLKIDRNFHTYKEYLWIVGFKRGDEKSLPGIEYLYINRVQRESEYGLVARLTMRRVVYSAYLKLSNNVPVFLGESAKETKILNKAEQVSAFFGTEVKKNY